MVILRLVPIFLYMSIFDSLIKQPFEERFSKEISFASGGELEITNVNGSIHVSSWDKESLKIEAQKIVRSHSEEEARKLLDKIEINIITKKNSILIETSIPSTGDITVQFNILTPQKLNLNLETTNGRITVEGINGDINLTTSNGAIECEKLSGSIVAESSNGKIILRHIIGRISASTKNGWIEGVIDSLDKNFVSSFETVNGDISLAIPEKLKPAIYAHTSNGKVKSAFPLISKKTDLDNRQGANISVATSNGCIDIKTGQDE